MFSRVVGVPDDTHMRFMLENAVDVAVESRVPKIVVEYPDRTLKIDELLLLV